MLSMAGYMLLSVEDGLIKVGDAPALGDIETEQGACSTSAAWPVAVLRQVQKGGKARCPSASKAR